MFSLTRRVTFAAAHRYRIPGWTDERNAEVFGLCARPSFHGHTYVCEVTVSGPLDPVTGFSADLGALDRILESEVRQRYDHTNLNVDIPEFGDGKLVPTGENLARVICEHVQTALGTAVLVTAVAISEDATLTITYEPDRQGPVRS